MKKVVINDNGGTKVASDFSYTLNGDTRSFDADGQNDLTVNAGTYNVTEPPVAGYATTYEELLEHRAPARRRGHVHGDEQRHRAEADRDQARDQQRRNRGGR